MNEAERSRVAGQLMSIIMIVSSILFPIVGYYVDKFGQRLRLLMLSCFLVVLAYTLFLQMYPTIPLILLGTGYGIFGAVLWPTVVFLVPKDKVVSYRDYKLS